MLYNIAIDFMINHPTMAGGISILAIVLALYFIFVKLSPLIMAIVDKLNF